MNSVTEQEAYMKQAIREARKAARNGDVPIGCIIVYDGSAPQSKADMHASELGITPGTVIGKGYNRRNKDHNALMHAEIIAIRKACKKFQDWRLEDCTMYVTLEPCPMCAGAIVQARLPRVVLGARNPKAGCCGSVIDLLHQDRLNHQAEMTEHILTEECQALMTDFFAVLREKKLKKIEQGS
ncbi:nucleoside deaminase [Oribacterium sp. HCP28S3_H8]|jgi:tRNA(adenine34) deaminase|uniref:nucleoside deaminase n=1 Tax=Oribacterium sp. HCP28S3_H8 TaxID=3438945 RepID=UPI003024D0DD|nr:nucleoside deaminase [Oribacterium sp.]